MDGNHDIVIGSRNSLTGNNLWVLNSDINAHNVEDGVLIVGGYVIELNDIYQVLSQPQEVIQCIKQEESNSRFRSWWGKAHSRRRTCI